MANRLASATSPYLLQHADNPVDWWEWGPEAFAEARARDVPILLSVGYAACHWCHVMAHESFEDDATAAFMNEHFVSVKVDREERPDVDAVYMQATTAMTGHGGWPMTCVLDHDGNPFFAGTYFPDQPRHGQPSFRQVLTALVDAWTTRGDDIRRVGSDLRDFLNQQAAHAAGPLGEAELDRAEAALAGEYDHQAPGFGKAPKFPPSMALEWLRRRGETDHARRDPGGDGARRDLRPGRRRLRALLRRPGVGGAALREDALRQRAAGRALRAPGWGRWGSGWRGRPPTSCSASCAPRRAGFASALDADSEGVEGKFYVWTQAELVDVLGPDDGAWAAETFHVTERGTFEHGTSTLQLLRDPDDVTRWADVRARLLAARESRTRPARDDKVVAAWNGLAITGLVDTGLRLSEPAYVDAAVAAGRLLLDLHLVDGRLRRVSRDGVVGAHAGVLEDYGAVASGFLSLVEATGDAAWLRAAGGPARGGADPLPRR